ncbi:phosphatidate cytidylyltransferase CdsA [Methyloglobulus morosus KoM1]|uniref:Phosphatidate cytidylyltransferase n=1 Tax=Methyloglobulus morosus KoM1 TaxID=1116472 RepID=V5BU62_9GAMM|nr:phosphatidate cytidylyltransferase [Methyloglobulus morosus]ESS71414.1 phosphatidate cytidylyltransferase CdsA [Methyloglobulus morosus KoM1]
MLQQRVITATILAALVVTAVFKLPGDYFSLILGLIILVAAWEWTHLIGINAPSRKYLFLLGLLLPMLWIQFWTQFLEGLQYVIETAQQDLYQHAKKVGWISISSFMEYLNIPDVRLYSGVLEWLVILPVIFWVLVMVLIKHSPTGVLNLELKPRQKAWMGWFVLLAAWMFLVRLRVLYGPEMAMYFLILIWVADISAFFVGKMYGKTKLAPEISPGKTMAGFYGALASAIVCGVLVSLLYGFPLMNASDFILLSVLTVLISIYGDLFFSVVKRQSGVKESGSILPGHGGLLDRIDSMIAATPFFYAGIFLIYRIIEDAQATGVAG